LLIYSILASGSQEVIKIILGELCKRKDQKDPRMCARLINKLIHGLDSSQSAELESFLASVTS
jgi:hypothetical protein